MPMCDYMLQMYVRYLVKKSLCQMKEIGIQLFSCQCGVNVILQVRHGTTQGIRVIQVLSNLQI